MVDSETKKTINLQVRFWDGVYFASEKKLKSFESFLKTHNEHLCRGFMRESTLAFYFAKAPKLLIFYEEFHQEWTFSNIVTDLFKCKYELKEERAPAFRFITQKERKLVPLSLTLSFKNFSQFETDQELQFVEVQCFVAEFQGESKHFSELVLISNFRLFRYFHLSYAEINMPFVSITSFILKRENEEMERRKDVLDFSEMNPDKGKEIYICSQIG